MTNKNETSYKNSANCKYYKKVLDHHRDVEEQLLCALKIAKLGIWTWNLKTKVVDLSPEVFSIIGQDSTMFDGSLDYIANHYIHFEHQVYYRNSVEADLAAGFVSVRDYRINHPSKNECWIRINGEILFDADHKPVRLIGTILDITDDYLSHIHLKSELSFFEALIESLPNPIFYKDYQGIYRYCNTAFLNYIGLSAEEVINKSVYDVAPKKLAQIYEQADRELMDSRGSQVYEANVRYADGSVHDVIFSKAAHVDSNNQILGLAGIMQDITEKKAIQYEVELLYKIKDVFLQVNHEIMFFEDDHEILDLLLVKLQSIFTECNQCTVLNVSETNQLTVVSSNGYDKEVLHDFDIPIESSYIWKDVKGKLEKAHIVNNTDHYLSQNSSEKQVQLSGAPIQSSLIVPINIDDKLKWIFCFDSSKNNVFTEIDRSVADFIREELPMLYRIFELHTKTLQLSRYDGLTGLMSRTYFDQVLDDRISLAKRHSKNILVVLFDLDGLKKVNDKYGHYSGDNYLTTFSNLLIETFRESDCFSRIGGDEFVGLYADTTYSKINSKILELRHIFENSDITSNHITFKGSFSYGIAKYPRDTLDKSKLLQIADARMYEDKSRNKK